jgi:hypothetical protein
MNWKSTATAAILVGLCAALFFIGPSLGKWLRLTSDKPDPKGDGTLAVLQDKLTADDISEIRLGEGKNEVLLTKSEGEWTLPGDWMTRTQEVNELVNRLSSLRSRFVPEKLDGEDPDLAQYGLKDPALVVRVKAGDESYRLAFGEGKSKEGPNRFGQPTYLRLDDKPEVVRLAPGLVDYLKHPASYFQQRRLFPVVRAPRKTTPQEQEESATATALTCLNKIKDADDSYSLAKVNDEWQLEKPYHDRVLDSKVQAILTTLPDVWVEQFVDAKAEKKPADYGFEGDERQAIILTKPNGKTVHLEIGKDAPPPEGAPFSVEGPVDYRYARLREGKEEAGKSGAIFIIKYSKLKQNVFQPFTSLRDPSVVTFNDVDAVHVEVDREKQRLIFDKDEKTHRWRMQVFDRDETGKDWKKEKSLESDVESSKLQDLLRELSALKFEVPEDVAYKDDPKFGLDATAVHVRIKVREQERGARPGADTEKKERDFSMVLSGKESEPGKLYVQLDGYPRITRVKNTLLPHALREARDFRQRRLFEWAANQVKSLSVQLNSEKIAFQHEAGTWKLVSPVSTAADSSRANQLAVDLGNLEVVEFLKPDQPDQKYGLDMPTATIETTVDRDGNDTIYKLTIGKERGAGQYFARLDGRNDILVIEKSIVDSLTRDSLSYRPLDLGKMLHGPLGEVQIEKPPQQQFSLIPNDGGWSVAGPFSAKVLTTLAQPIADALAHLKAERYVTHKATDEELAKFGLKDPYLRVTLIAAEKGSASGSGSGSASSSSSSEGSESRSSAGSGSSSGSHPMAPVVLLIGGNTAKDPGSRYARFAGDDAVFIVGGDLVHTLDVQPLALINPRVLDLPADAPTVGYQSNAGGKNLKLEMKDDKWQVTESAAGPFVPDRDAVEHLLLTLRQLTAREFKAYGSDIDWEKFGLKSPALKATITLKKEGARPHQIQVGNALPEGKGASYARVDDMQAVIVLDPPTAATLREDYLAFVDRQVFWDLNPEKITRVSIQQGGKTFELEKKDADWQIAGTTPLKADDETVNELLRRLAALRAKRVAAYPVKELKDVTPDSAAPAAVIKLTGEKEIELQLGKKLDEATGERLAIVSGSSTAFVLDGDIVGELMAAPVYFRDHVVARIKDDVDHVILEIGDKKAEFAKIDGTWKLKTDVVEAEVDHDELEDFVNRLSKLRADELVVEKPGDLKTYGLDPPLMRWRLKAGDKDVLVLLMGKQGPDKELNGHKLLRYFGRVDKGDIVFLLDEKTSIQALGRFRVRRIWPNLTAEQVQAIRYQSPKSNFELTRKGESWQSSDPTLSVDPKRVDEALQALANLRAERFVGEKGGDLEPFGLKEPTLKLEIVTAKGKLELQVGKEEPGTGRLYARALGGATTDVFLLAAPDVFRIVRPPSSFAKPPGGIGPGGLQPDR